MARVRIGFIKYANSMPFYHEFDSAPLAETLKIRCSEAASGPAGASNAQCGFEFEIIYDAPARLNDLISNGGLDIATISAFEYVKNRAELQLLNKINISATERVMSVLLASRKNMTELSGQTIMLSNESASAASLFKILAEDFFGCAGVKYVSGKVTAENIGAILDGGQACAVMAIGDEALKYFEKNRTSSAANIHTANGEIKVFDLCQQWNRFTGLPFVFGILAARKDFYFGNKKICDKLCAAIKSKVDFFNSNRDIFAEKAFKSCGVSLDTMKEYYGLLNYEFRPEHIMALEEFEKRLKKINAFQNER
ncbi:MAG TPA: menaquinone biosynthesis protein [Candidatus Wallbacteria bacterium]|nr:MAG: Chorismate dehydratase [bacterium ADurb.Bin243]HPG57041.1 menaquinone biosynthesis protein [Candidatus Wallbacteria bacterium]